MSSMSGPGAGRQPGESRDEARRRWLAIRTSIANFTIRSPARLTLGAFLIVITLFTSLLAAPFASSSGRPTPLHDALFTAVSSVCVTGLTTVSTAEHWSFLGQLIIIVGTFIGGLGILTLASIMSLAVSRKLGVRAKLMAQNSMNTSGASALGEVGSLLRIVILTAISLQALIALFLIPRFYILGESLLSSIWHGVFYAISAFNNAGFALYSDNIIGFADDPWICVPLLVAVVLGGIGFPVLFEIGRHLRGRRRRWSLHTRLTVTVTAVLLVLGPLLVMVLEWGHTLSGHPLGAKLLIATFQGVMPRTAGFNSVDYAQMDEATLLVTDLLMFIGGGSGGTAGGIKVTTFAVLLFVILAEVRGEKSVTIFDRRIDPRVQRQALSVALIGVALVVIPTLALLAGTGFDLDALLFEVISAFATVGLSTGITAQLPAWGQVILVVLMYLGRIGPITLVGALAARENNRRFERPVERPFIG